MRRAFTTYFTTPHHCHVSSRRIASSIMYLPLRAQPWIYQTDLRYLLCAQSVSNMHIVHGKPIEMKEKWIRKMHRCYSQHDISFHRWSIASFKNFLKIHTRFLPFFFSNNSQIRFPPKNRISKKLRSAIQTSTRMISDRRDRMNSLFLPPFLPLQKARVKNIVRIEYFYLDKVVQRAGYRRRVAGATNLTLDCPRRTIVSPVL